MAGRGLSGVLMRGFGMKDHDATVTGVEHLTPKFVRVRMTSPTLFDEVEPGPTAWLRFWFPDPDGSGAQHQRGYTLSEADPATGRFAIDVVLHEPEEARLPLGPERLSRRVPLGLLLRFDGVRRP